MNVEKRREQLQVVITLKDIRNLAKTANCGIEERVLNEKKYADILVEGGDTPYVSFVSLYEITDSEKNSEMHLSSINMRGSFLWSRVNK